MGRKDLHKRLERLERQVPQPADQAERDDMRTEHYLEHFRVWSVGGELEEIPEEIRDAKMWAHAEEYGPVFLGLVWEGILEGREEFLADGVDFTLAEDSSDTVGGRRHPPPDRDSYPAAPRG